jgi:MoaA/NifB/PqqE/SkfB family radical SAM enzyme
VTYIKKLKPHEFSIWHGKRPLLGQLDIELTERCNNNCVHCCINLPENDTNARNREMDTAFVQGLLRQAADLGCLTVRFTGGEPLLREDFQELYVFTRRLGMRVILFTNGRLITPELADLLARIPPGRVVEVSVYGMHAESYEAAAGARGSFAEFRRGVERLRERGIPFMVRGAILPPNKGEWEEFKEWAAGIPSMDYLPVESMNFALRARRDDPAKNERIRKLRLSPEETVRMLAKYPRYLNEMHQFCGKFMRPPGDKLFSCGAGHGTCVDAYGQAQMCMGLRDPGTVYDLRRGADCHCERSEAIANTHEEITSSQKAHGMTRLRYALTEFFPRLREMRATNPDYLRRCAQCFLKGLCEQCPAKSWMEHGTLDTPVEYLCAIAHAQAGYLGLLTEKESAWEVEDGRERVKGFSGSTVQGSTVQGFSGLGGSTVQGLEKHED